MAFDVGAGLSEMGKTVSQFSGYGMIQQMREEADKQKIILAQQLASDRQSQMLEQQHGYRSQEIEQTQTGLGALQQRGREFQAEERTRSEQFQAGQQQERLQAQRENTQAMIQGRQDVAKMRNDFMMEKLGLSRLPTGPVLDEAAKTFLDTGQVMGIGGFNSAAVKTQVVSRAIEMAQAQGKSLADYRPQWATVKSSEKVIEQVNKQATMVKTFSDTMDKQITLAKRQMDEGVLGPTTVPVIDHLIQWGRGKLGDSRLSPFELQLKLIATEGAKLATGQLGMAGLPEGARTEYERIVNSFQNRQTIEKVFDSLQYDAQARLTSSMEQMDQARQAIKTGQPVNLSATPTRTPENPGGVQRLPGNPADWTDGSIYLVPNSSGKLVPGRYDKAKNGFMMVQ